MGKSNNGQWSVSDYRCDRANCLVKKGDKYETIQKFKKLWFQKI